VLATGGPGALLGSPFNVKWRFSAPVGDVEESKLCLFSVIMPAECVSSVSPRFHYRRVTFCFLPLAAILEFPSWSFLEIHHNFIALPTSSEESPHFLCQAKKVTDISLTFAFFVFRLLDKLLIPHINIINA
jgi:hypothetical protein